MASTKDSRTGPAIIASPLSRTNSRRARPAIRRGDQEKRLDSLVQRVGRRNCRSLERHGLGRSYSTGHGSRRRQGLRDACDAGPHSNDVQSCAQGDTKAGRQLLEVIARAESGRTGAAVEFLQQAVQYKETYVPIFEQHEREGVDPPDIFPHPDDIIIDDDDG